MSLCMYSYHVYGDYYGISLSTWIYHAQHVASWCHNMCQPEDRNDTFCASWYQYVHYATYCCIICTDAIRAVHSIDTLYMHAISHAMSLIQHHMVSHVYQRILIMLRMSSSCTHYGPLCITHHSIHGILYNVQHTIHVMQCIHSRGQYVMQCTIAYTVYNISLHSNTCIIPIQCILMDAVYETMMCAMNTCDHYIYMTSYGMIQRIAYTIQHVYVYVWIHIHYPLSSDAMHCT